MEEHIPHKNWFSRNWKWAVPTGGCLLLIILAVVLAGSIIVGVTTLFSDSEPYQEAFSRAENNDRVIEILGKPLESDGIPQGSINYTNGDGSVGLNIPLKGPKGTALLTVIGNEIDEEWTYETIKILIEDTGEEIDLTEDIHPN